MKGNISMLRDRKQDQNIVYKLKLVTTMLSKYKKSATEAEKLDRPIES